MKDIIKAYYENICEMQKNIWMLKSMYVDQILCSWG